MLWGGVLFDVRGGVLFDVREGVLFGVRRGVLFGVQCVISHPQYVPMCSLDH